MSDDVMCDVLRSGRRQRWRGMGACVGMAPAICRTLDLLLRRQAARLRDTRRPTNRTVAARLKFLAMIK